MSGFMSRMFGGKGGGPPASGVAAFFAGDHQVCDGLWSKLEAALDGDDAATAEPLWSSFHAAMQRHLRMEEEVLFPAFEEVSGMRNTGPTQVMRAEHEQMRSVLADMGAAMDDGGLQRVLDLGDTLFMLIQQHNMKEENMLYPMADQMLTERWADLERQLASY